MPADVIGLIILIACVVLFLIRCLPEPVVGLIGCILMVLLGVTDFKTAFSGFSNSIVLLMASSMIVGIAMFKTGTAQSIGRIVMRLARNNEKIFLMASCIVSGILAMFLANTAVLAADIPIVDGVCQSNGNMKRMNLLLPIACSVMIGGVSTLIGCTPQLTANALLISMSGMEMGMWDLTGPGLCLFAVFLIYTFFFGIKTGNKIWGDRKEERMDIDENLTKSVICGDVDKRKMIIMYIIAIAMIISYICSPLPIAVTAICAALLCIITGCCSFKNVVSELNWESIIFLASCLGLAEAITTAGTGELIGNFVFSLIGNISSPIAIFAILVILTLFISQFITNSTAIIITLPLALSLCKVYGFNPMAFCIGITIAASIACCTPLAASQIAMTQVAGYKFTDYLKYCLKPTLLLCAVTIITVPMFYPLTV